MIKPRVDKLLERTDSHYAAVMVTEQGSKSVNEAIKTVNDAGSTIRTLADIVSEAVQAAAQIALPVSTQALSSLPPQPAEARAAMTSSPESERRDAAVFMSLP